MRYHGKRYMLVVLLVGLLLSGYGGSIAQEATATPSFTPSFTVTPTATSTYTPSFTPSFTVTPTNAPTTTPSFTFTPTPVMPTLTLTEPPLPTPTPVTPTVTPGESPVPIEPPTPVSETPTDVPLVTQTPVETPTESGTLPETPTLTPTPTLTATATETMVAPSPTPVAFQAQAVQTYTVNSTTDPGDGVCNVTECTLREAIIAANANTGFTDTIAFNIPGAGPHTIQPTSALPILTDPVIIDGWTEPDFAGTPVIELDGSLAGDIVKGLEIRGGNSTVRGLVINNFTFIGLMTGSNGNNVIEGNYIGTDVTGTAAHGNENGIMINDTQYDRIGGTAVAQRNVVSGNKRYGIVIRGAGTSSTYTTVQGNYIGVDATGTAALGNDSEAIEINGSNNNLIGGTDSGMANVIAGNNSIGISFQNGSSASSVIGNYIGLNSAGTALGNHRPGILVGGASIQIFISQNQIAFNTDLGISFNSDSVTPNDPGDGDTGGNNLQNYPVLSIAETSGSSIAVTGILNSTASRSFRAEFFANDTCAPSGYGQGQYYLGSAQVTTNASGDATINTNLTASVSAGQYITSTATDLTTNDTSEFSACVQATTPASVQTYTVNSTADPGDGVCNVAECTLREAINAANANTGFTDTIAFNIPGAGPHTIQPTSVLPTITDPVIIDGWTEPDYVGTPVIEINGSLAGAGVDGLHLSGGNSTVRGLVINRFSGNGIVLDSSFNTIQSNYIGTDITGTLNRGNGDGVFIHESANNLVGGMAAVNRNLISGNSEYGIILGINATSNLIQGNIIGADVTGTFDLGNGGNGIGVSWAANNNTIGGTQNGAGNLIAYNAGRGVNADSDHPGLGNPILGNSIVSNGTLGIGGDTPIYNSNQQYRQNFPDILNIQLAGNTLTISGRLSGIPNTLHRLEFFVNDACDPSYFGEGQTYLGFIEATTGDNPDGLNGTTDYTAIFTTNVSAGQYITATGTNLTTNKTSEFSYCVRIGGAATTFTVNTTDDTDDGVCDAVHCSLREALIWSTLNPGKDTIAFNIPGPGPHTIQEQSRMPGALTPVIIDGWTEPDFGGTPIIELDAALITDWYALQIHGGDSTIRGLVLNGGDLIGLLVYMYGNNVIEGNYIGTDVTGAQVKGNRVGIEIYVTTNDRIGGTTPASRNVIAGNLENIIILGPGGTTIQGNYIGVDATGTVVLSGSEFGIVAGDGAIVIGGTELGAGNIIGGNNIGVSLFTTGSTVTGNFIGTNASGDDLGNLSAGILIWSDETQNQNLVSQNHIAFNGSLGIDLSPTDTPDGVTPNDPGDGDTGPNNYQNFPVLSSAATNGGSITVTGTLNSTANTAFQVEFFANNTCDPSGYGEGQYYLGSAQVTTNSSGDAAVNANLTATVSVGQFITATATDLTTNDTSEFSACVEATAAAGAQTYTVNSTADPGDGVCNVAECTLREAIIAANNHSGFTDTIAFNIPGAGPHTIQPTTALPTITDPVIIDGWTEPDYAGTPVIELDGSLTGTGVDGLHLSGGNSTLRGLIINRFGGNGLVLDSNANTIQGNTIGTNSGGATGIGNSGDGIKISATANNNTIGGTQTGAGNLIAYNTGRGVYAEEIDPDFGTGNAILGNNILNNGALDIDLRGDGVTPNDEYDYDTGANNLQNYPLLTRVAVASGTVYINGILDSTPYTGQVYRIEFFANDTCDSMGYGGGQYYLGSMQVNGISPQIITNFPTNVTVGQFVTATATDLATNDTSEFSACEEVGIYGTHTYTVNTTDDVDDGICDATHCSLQEAINEANDNVDFTDTIVFNIPGPDPYTIQPIMEAPQYAGSCAAYLIREGVIIDGTTQPGYAGSPLIDIDGSLFPPLVDGNECWSLQHGLLIIGQYTTIRGLVIRNFPDVGIYSSWGNNTIEGNYIGTDVTGTIAQGNGIGLWIHENNSIGGTTPEKRNLISGNGIGIRVYYNDNVIQGNYIGTDITGTQNLGNIYMGIDIFSSGWDPESASNNLIGGTEPGAGNLIAFNGNSSVRPDILYGPGINVETGGDEAVVGNAILGNRIFSNYWQDIALQPVGYGFSDPRFVTPEGVTPNDPGDADMGANRLQNYPVLSSAATNGSSVTIAGTFNSTANRSFRLEFFANDVCHSTGYGGGQYYLGFLDVTTNGSGDATVNANLTAAVSAEQFITATATDLTNNDTSEFSACVEATGFTDLAITKTDTPDPVLAGADLTYTLTIANQGSQTATGVELTDILPMDVNFVSADVTQGAGSCSEDAGTVTCSLEDMLASDTTSVSIIVTVDITTAGQITNTVTITSTEPDSDPSDNTATATTTITAPPLPGRVTLVSPRSGTQVNDATPELIWNPATNAAHYQIQVDDDSRFRSPEQDTIVADSPYNAGPLPDGRWYWRVRPLNSVLQPGAWTGVWYFTVDTVVPDAPVLTAPVDNSVTYLTRPTYRWRAVRGANLYRLQVADSSDFSRILLDIETNRTAIVSPAVLAQGMYYWQVAARDVAGNWGDFSPVWALAINLQRSPADGSATRDTTPAFVWAGYSGATSYRLEVATDAAFTQPVSGFPVDTTRTSYGVPAANALPYGTYYWRVSVDTGAGVVTSPFSYRLAVTSASPLPPLLTAPTRGASINSNRPELTWNATRSAGNELYTYEVQIDNDSRFGSPDQTAVVNGLTHITDPLTDGRWFWRVRTIDTYGAAGRWSGAWYFTVDTLLPDAPRLYVPLDGSVTYVTRPVFRWYVVRGANLYRLQVADTSDFSTVILDIETNRTAIASPNVLPQGTYYWHAAARDVAGNWSAFSEARTLVINLQRSPADGAATTDTTPAFSWAGYPGAVSYRLEVATDAAFTQPVSGFPVDTTRGSYGVPAANALLYGTYYWRVSVDTGSGMTTSPFSYRLAITSVSPLPPVLSAPLRGIYINTSTPELTWNATRSAGNEPYTYEIQIDDDSRFRSPDQTAVANGLTHITDPLTDGRWFWRVRTIDTYGAVGRWSGVWYFTVDTLLPDAPRLYVPLDSSATYLTRPTFRWRAVGAANLYRLQVADTSDFSSILLDIETNRTAIASPNVLPQGTYYWQVAARDVAGNWGDFSPSWMLVINLQRSPADGTATTDTTPGFAWAGYPGAVSYRLEVATDAAFTQPVSGFPVDTTRGSYGVPAANALPYGTYYWRVSVDTGAGAVTSPFNYTLAVTPALPLAPVLVSPSNRLQLAHGQPILSWTASRTGTGLPFTYEIQIDNDSRFRSPDVTGETATTSFVPSVALGDGRWYWRVRTVNTYGAAGRWGRVWYFVVDAPSP